MRRPSSSWIPDRRVLGVLRLGIPKSALQRWYASWLDKRVEGEVMYLEQRKAELNDIIAGWQNTYSRYHRWYCYLSQVEIPRLEEERKGLIENIKSLRKEKKGLEK